MQQEIFDIVLEQDDVTWKTLLYDLVKSEEMDPWDVDVSLLAQKYVQTIKKMEGLDFRVSGKVILAAALLLKFKSSHLVEQGFNELDRLIAAADEPEDTGFFQEFGEAFWGDAPAGEGTQRGQSGEPKIIPRTPQPRRRKVSIHDLTKALQKALEVKIRKIERSYPKGLEIKIPKKKMDIGHAIRDVYGRIRIHFHKNKGKLMLDNLLPGEYDKDAAVFTFIPLLHLTNQRKIDLHQQKHFGPIQITLAKLKKGADKELGDA